MVSRNQFVRLFIRGLIYFCFSQLWWLSLELLPVGVATVTIYATPGIVAPIFARLLLGEQMHWSFPILFILNLAGILAIYLKGMNFLRCPLYNATRIPVQIFIRFRQSVWCLSLFTFFRLSCVRLSCHPKSERGTRFSDRIHDWSERSLYICSHIDYSYVLYTRGRTVS